MQLLSALRWRYTARRFTEERLAAREFVQVV